MYGAHVVDEIVDICGGDDMCVIDVGAAGVRVHQSRVRRARCARPDVVHQSGHSLEPFARRIVVGPHMNYRLSVWSHCHGSFLVGLAGSG